MQSLQINTENIPKELAVIAKSFSGTINRCEEGYSLTIDRNIGYGAVKCIVLDEGVKVLSFAITLYHDIKISIDLFNPDSIQFLYCMEGNCFHKFEKPLQVTPISTYQSAVMHHNQGLKSSLLIQPGEPFNCSIVVIDKTYYTIEDNTTTTVINQEHMRQLIETIESEASSLHLSSYNLRIAEQLKQIAKKDHENNYSNVLSNKGHYYLSLALHIDQFFEDIEKSSNTSGLQKRELDLISKTSDYIKEYPQLQHTIRALYEYSGLSPAKLQDGFKYLFNKTVSDYVRSVRLEKAEELIRNTDLSISEIVYSVGLTSRSYFCKIFKKRFHFNPKEYRSRNKVLY